MKKFYLSRFKLVTKFYGVDPPASPPVSPPPPPVSPPPPPPPPPPPVSPPTPLKTFTEDEVAKMMEGHRKGLQAQNAELITQLENLRQNTSLTAQQRDELEARIQTLSQQHLTKEQQGQEAYSKLEKKYNADIKAASDKEVVWKSRFETLVVENAISTGAVQHKARSAEQLQMMLKSQVKVVEELGDDGKPTGNWVAKMTVATVDPKDKAKKINVELPVVEAIGKLRENEQFQNLFDMDGRPGLGGGNWPRGGLGLGGNNQTPDFANMGTEEFMKWRKANPPG